MAASSLIQTQIPPTFLAPTPLVKDIYHIVGSTIVASTLNTKTINASTVSGNVIQANTLQFNTVDGNTIQADTLSAGMIIGSTIQANTFIAPIIQGSTIQTNTLYYNTLVGSTINTTNLQVASLIGSTIRTNTLGLFDYEVMSDPVIGEYITFDLGTGGNYHNQYTQIINSGWSWINKIQFLGSNNGIKWFNLGLSTGTVSSNTQTFNYISTNYRYLRMVFIEVYTIGTTNLVLFNSCTISNNGGTNLFPTTFSQISLSANIIPGLSYFVTSQFIVNINNTYSPVSYGSTGYYTGTLGTNIYTGTIARQPAILVLTASTLQANVLQVNTLSGSTIQTNVLQASTIIGTAIQTNTFITSTIIGSTIQSDRLQVSTLYTSDTSRCSTLQANQLLFNTLSGGIIQANIFNTSTLNSSTIQMNQFNINILPLLGSTISINTLNVNTLTGSTFTGSTIQANIINVQNTLVGSTIYTNIINSNNIVGSTIQTNFFRVSTLLNNQLTGNTIGATQFTGSSISSSTIQTNVLQVSTIVGSTIQASQLNVSTLTGSTLQIGQSNANTIIVSTIQTSILDVSTIIGSTIQMNTLQISTIVGSTVRITAYTASTIIGNIIQTTTHRATAINCSSIIGNNIQTPQLIASSIYSSTIIGNNFQGNKIVITDGNNALATSATNATQLQYITNLLSQASGTNQTNQWNASQTFLISSIYFNGLNTESAYYILGLNSSNQLIQNILTESPGTFLGTLTQNYIPYASTTTIFANSNIYRVNATDIAIGQTTSAFPTGTGTTLSIGGLTQTTRISATTGTFSRIFMDDKRSGLNGTLIPGNQGYDFYMGTMNNNGSQNISDTLYLNSWTDTSAGYVNIVMFDKNNIAMRIFQGAVGATSNFTSYANALLTDTNSQNITIGQISDTDGITFGPNVSWNSYLKVGAGNNRFGTSVAQCIANDGNLYLDAGNGNDIYLNYYSYTNGSQACTIEMHGAIKMYDIPQQTNLYAYPLTLSGNKVSRSQALTRELFRSNGVAWGGGVNMVYAFYKYNPYVSVNISGKLSYDISLGQSYMAYPYMRIYSRSGDRYYYYSLQAYTNNWSAHITQPFELILVNSDLEYSGWYDVYIYNAGGCNTFGGDCLYVNVTILPGSAW